ncbi:MAG: NYN domain-containing protein [Patescibacteria group bacterium]
MIAKYVTGKAYVFIDISNLFYSQKSLGWRIAYAKLMHYLKRECGRDTKCFVYIAYNERNLKERKFLDLLDIHGYIVRSKPLKKITGKNGVFVQKGNLDIELAFEMVELADQYDTAVLMSGDSDFAVALDRVKNKGKRVIVISTRGRISRELIERSKYIDMRKIKKDIIL